MDKPLSHHPLIGSKGSLPFAIPSQDIASYSTQYVWKCSLDQDLLDQVGALSPQSSPVGRPVLPTYLHTPGTSRGAYEQDDGIWPAGEQDAPSNHKIVPGATTVVVLTPPPPPKRSSRRKL